MSEEAVSLATLKQTIEKVLMEIKKTQDEHCYSGEMSNVPYAEYLRGQKNSLLKVLSVVEKFQKQLLEIIEDFSHIPDRRLPIGKNAWLQEWTDKEQELKRVLGEGNKP